MGELIYCPFCRKLVEPNESDGWCSICNYDLPSLTWRPEAPPKAVSEPAMETEPEDFPEEAKVETEADEVVSLEDLLAKG